MRLRYIEMFQAMLQAESVTGAARLLNISQPAATKLLQQAERQLGYPLFIRVMGRVRLTREGEVLRPKIERIADELAELQQLAVNLKPSDAEMLRVVSTPTLANTLIPNVVTRMRKTFRKVEINLFTQHTREMLNSLLLHECDVGLTLQQIEHPRIRCQLLSEGQVMVIAPTGHWSTSDLARPLPPARGARLDADGDEDLGPAGADPCRPRRIGLDVQLEDHRAQLRHSPCIVTCAHLRLRSTAIGPMDSQMDGHGRRRVGVRMSQRPPRQGF